MVVDKLDSDFSTNEKDWLDRLKTGDKEAFTLIYNTYRERLFFVAHKRLYSSEDAKEVVQDVFLTLWQKRERLEIQALSGYLAAMVRHAVYRQRARRQKIVEGAQELHRKKGDAIAPFDIESKQFLEILHTLAHELPEKCRIVFLNHKLLDMPLNEVAMQLGISQRTAEDYVTLAMRTMRKHREGLAYFFVFLFP